MNTVWRLALGLEFALAATAALALVYIIAPYGRFMRSGWGPSLASRWGWVVMELPAFALMPMLFWTGPHARAWVPALFLLIWELHYAQRTWIYPLRMRSDRRMPWVVVLMGFAFNLLNGFVNGWGLFHMETARYGVEWLRSPAFVAGLALFLCGYAINLHSDAVLRRLRYATPRGYRIPHEGLHAWVASPNYFGECLEWLGWAVLTWSWGGLAFAVFTWANLAPRAWACRRWYRETFGAAYPATRKALIPHVW